MITTCAILEPRITLLPDGDARPTLIACAIVPGMLLRGMRQGFTEKPRRCSQMAVSSASGATATWCAKEPIVGLFSHRGMFHVEHSRRTRRTRPCNGR